MQRAKKICPKITPKPICSKKKQNRVTLQQNEAHAMLSKITVNNF